MPSAAADDGRGKRRPVGMPPARAAAADFAMGGAAAVVAKTGAAPVERVKLLLQNQAEMLRRGSLTRPYRGIADAFGRVLREEGVAALWRGNQANVIRYFPTQVRCSIRFLPPQLKSFFRFDRLLCSRILLARCSLIIWYYYILIDWCEANILC